MTNTTDPVTAEIAAHDTTATLAQEDGRWVLTMTRELRHPVERVWPKLTEPGELAKWSPVVPDRPLTSAGPATAAENPGDPANDAEVLVCDPPRELVHRWGPHLLRWTLTPTPDGSRLTLAHVFGDRAEAGMYGAGWHLCLAVLAVILGGQDVPRVTGSRAHDYGWASLRQRYDATVA
ncbi:MAG TPA: SRPBCC family protein [Streptosporangiaceae bacterium]|nr:SRPBCC family protein [Streptosporangiaceae bacterium]